MTADAGRWLGDRLGQVPDELRSWLDIGDVIEETADGREAASDRATEGEIGPSTVADELARRGLEALDGALARPGRNRETAFRLLAADAYLTWASEAMVESPEPEGALVDLIRRIGADLE